MQTEIGSILKNLKLATKAGFGGTTETATTSPARREAKSQTNSGPAAEEEVGTAGSKV